ncbi:MAG: serine/threonine-protein kinase [Acidobacteriota bacterium]
MDPARWQRLKGLFQRAVELDGARRREFLDACEDPLLRAEVEGLLRDHAAAGDFIEGPAVVEPSPDRSLLGRRLGPYRILRELGHGGMGSVYLAERTDQQYQQQVAVKLLKAGLGSGDLVARFRLERQILANLAHPGIARLLDGGTLGDGRPYLVMELIDGEPIVAHCGRRRLPLERRVELFREVCDAVSYAHRRLVIHRDLKPSNILVTADGAPKLLDFGTAKLVDTSGDEAPMTAPGLRLLTPDYASPEQLRGETITTASDVYSLGVVLFELLTGTRPFSRGDALGVGPRAEGAEPPRPSAAVPPQDARALEGDLDNIVGMALRDEPLRRYPSVDQLSEDLGRYLADLPVRARPDTVGYRTGKWIRRHRALAVALTMAVLALLGGILAASWQAREAQAQRQMAEAAFEFVVGVLKESDPRESGGEEVTARQILDRGADRLLVSPPDRPELRVRLLDTIADVYFQLGVIDRAEVLLEEARGVADAHAGALSESRATVLDRLGQVYGVRGDPDAAAALLEEALDLRRRRHGDRHPRVADSYNSLGVYHYATGELAAARDFHERALELRRALGVPGPRIADSLNNLGTVLLALGEPEAAQERLRQALDVRRANYGDPHPKLANSLNNLAAARLSAGALGEAAELFRGAYEMQDRLYGGADHRRSAATLANLALVEGRLGRTASAEGLYGEALAMWRRLGGDDHPEVAAILHDLGVLFADAGEPARAAEQFRLAIDAAADAGIQSLYRSDLAWHLHRSGRHEAAAEEFRRLLPGAAEGASKSGDGLDLATVSYGLGLSLAALGDPGAGEALRRALRLRRRDLGPDHRRTVAVAQSLDGWERRAAGGGGG